MGALVNDCWKLEEEFCKLGGDEAASIMEVRRRDMGRSGEAVVVQHKLKHMMLMEMLQPSVVLPPCGIAAPLRC